MASTCLLSFCFSIQLLYLVASVTSLNVTDMLEDGLSRKEREREREGVIERERERKKERGNHHCLSYSLTLPFPIYNGKAEVNNLRRSHEST